MNTLVVSLAFCLFSWHLMAIDLHSAGARKYDALWESLDSMVDNKNAFWQLAIGFETLVDYKVATHQDPTAVLEKADGVFQKKTTSDKNWWWDDFGWWGLFFMKAHALSPQSSHYEQMAEQCFNKINDEAPYAWDKANAEIRAEQEPLFTGGCFNADLVPAKANEGLLGCQNTVTNATFLGLSLRLFLNAYHSYAKAPEKALGEKVKKYWEAVTRQQTWFLNWFSESLLNASINLVEERPSKYKKGQAVISYRANRAWIADQGLILGAMQDLLASKKAVLDSKNPLSLDVSFIDDKQLITIAQKILTGVVSKLTDENNVLINYCQDEGDNFPFGDFDDYVNGTGIFVRLLRYANQINPNFQKIINATAQNAALTDLPVTDLSSFDIEQNRLADINASLALEIKTQGFMPMPLVNIYDRLCTFVRSCCCCGCF